MPLSYPEWIVPDKMRRRLKHGEPGAMKGVSTLRLHLPFDPLFNSFSISLPALFCSRGIQTSLAPLS